MLEECFRCGAFAPSWEEGEYAEWTSELAADGEYLGVVCPGCFAGDGLVFVHLRSPAAAAVELRARESGGRLERDDSRAEAA